MTIVKIRRKPESCETYQVMYDNFTIKDYYVYKNPDGFYEFSELKYGKFVNRASTDFKLTRKRFLELLYEGE